MKSQEKMEKKQTHVFQNFQGTDAPTRTPQLVQNNPILFGLLDRAWSSAPVEINNEGGHRMSKN